MVVLLIILLALELVYFRLADRFHIIDKPNQRSSHFYITRRGGGIIFPVAWLLFSLYQGIYLPWFTLGLLMIAAVSFMDDVKEVKVVPRIFIHIISFLLAFYDLGLFNILPWWLIIPSLFLSIAALNAINFMDGINGITGLYAIVFWMTIAFIESENGLKDVFTLTSPFPYIIFSILVFGYFNFRKRAVCFAGDVGSVSMAYLMIGMVYFLVFRPETGMITTIKSGSLLTGSIFDLKYLLLLSVYGIDSCLTIVHRLLLKENILKGHRKHLYQYLANEMGWSHIMVAIIYAVVQLSINSWVLTSPVSGFNAIILLVTLSLVYVSAKYIILRQMVSNATFEQMEVADSSDLARRSA